MPDNPHQGMRGPPRQEQAESSSGWCSVLARMRSRAPAGDRMALMVVKVITVNGEPVSWSKPEVTMIESAMSPAELLTRLGAEEQNGVKS